MSLTSRLHRPRPARSARAPRRAGPVELAVGAALVAGGLLASSCTGNPSCVFGPGCAAGAGGSSNAPAAVVPANGQWISEQLPVVTDVFPSGAGVAPSSPIVLVFNESMNEDSLEGAFEIIPIAGNIVMPPLTNVGAFLVGAGRVLVLVPETDLDVGNYVVQAAATVGSSGGGPNQGAPEQPTDLTGQRLDHAIGEQLGQGFTVTSPPAVTPSVVMTWPRDGDSTASETPDVVVVFDRAIDDTTVNDSSFGVTIDGMDPAFDPAPMPLGVPGGGTETRVYTWRSLDDAGEPAPLGHDEQIRITLSPIGFKIADTERELLPATTVDFRTLLFATPKNAALLSSPPDAIGIENLTANGVEDLLVQVEVAGIAVGDILEVFLFGDDASLEEEKAIALRRTTTLDNTAVTTGFAELALTDLAIGEPGASRFADGELAFAFRLRRAATFTPVSLLDVDAFPGVTSPVLDTERPVVARFGISSDPTGTGSLDAFVSDQRDLVLTGVADEPLCSVEVDAGPLGDNGLGMRPPVVGGRASDGAFIAAPVPLGVAPGGVASFTAVAYDVALNASLPLAGTFRQPGAVAPAAPPGLAIEVHAFDARSLESVEGARVILHDDAGDGVSFPFRSAATTDADGRADLTPGTATSIVTVDHPDFDLFSFHGAMGGTRVSVPLRALGADASSRTGGTIDSSDPAVAQLLPGMSIRVDDSRRPSTASPTFPPQACSVLPCFYGSEPVFPERLGAQSLFAGRFQTIESSFSPSELLEVFCLEVPLGPIATGSAPESSSFDVPFLLQDTTVEEMERPDELRRFDISATGIAGLDPTDLADLDADTTGLPGVTVEALIPGVPSSVAVGLGLAFQQGGADEWSVRSARPGAVAPMGAFDATVDTNLLLRAELRDVSGNVAARRPRHLSLPDPGPATLVIPDVAHLLTPAPGSATAAAEYTVSFPDTIPDAFGSSGLYRVDLLDGAERRWELWRPDAAGASDVLVRVPDLTPGAGTGLQDGPIACEISAFAWTGLDTADFLWSDVDREHDLFTRSATETFTQGPMP